MQCWPLAPPGQSWQSLADSTGTRLVSAGGQSTVSQSRPSGVPPGKRGKFKRAQTHMHIVKHMRTELLFSLGLWADPESVLSVPGLTRINSRVWGPPRALAKVSTGCRWRGAACPGFRHRFPCLLCPCYSGYRTVLTGVSYLHLQGSGPYCLLWSLKMFSSSPACVYRWVIMFLSLAYDTGVSWHLHLCARHPQSVT